MKNRISGAMLWIVALLFVAQSTSAQAQSFEGRVIQTVSVPQLGEDKLEMVMNVKGDQMMISMDMGPMGAMKMYTQKDGKSMIMIMGTMGFEIDLQEANELAKQANNADPGLKATGKRETINGYASEEWTANLEKGTMTMWLTSDIDKGLVKSMQTAMKAQNAQNPSAAQAEIARLLAEKGMIAVRTIVSDGDQVAVTIDLVKIEKSSVPDSIFTPPSDVKIQKMPLGNGGAAD